MPRVALGPSEALIRFEVTEHTVLVWLIRNGRVAESIEVPMGRSELYGLVNDYLAAFHGLTAYSQLGNFNIAAGKKLYELLMKEVLTRVAPHENIIIVPDEILEVLPFEALVMDTPSEVMFASGAYGPYPQGVKYVGDQYSISYYHSATSLTDIRTLKKWAQAEKPLLVLADPVFSEDPGRSFATRGGRGTTPAMDLRRIAKEQREWQLLGAQFDQLPLTAEMAKNLKRLIPEAELLLEMQASEAELRKRSLKDYRYLVFATHGILANEVPYIKEPALVLSQAAVQPEERDRDGFLTMCEVMKLNVASEVVALTACSTGLGLNVSGEGVMGMGRAFQYAGAKSVLVSLWSVEDQSTNLLTERFFTHLKEHKNKLVALQLARADVRRAGYEHPFFWAPFILVGEY